MSTCLFNRKEWMKQWRKNNKEELKQYDKQYHIEHREQKKERGEIWRKNNPEYSSDYNRQYYKENCRKELERIRQYRQTKLGKIACKKVNSKHRRLGFFPLNNFFDGCEAHHISENFVIYIPKEIHKALRHNIWTWKNMEQMNKLAIEFL